MYDKISITAILVLMLIKIKNCCLLNCIAQDKCAWGEIIDLIYQNADTPSRH